MWKWDQGRMQYFQFDTIRTICSFIISENVKKVQPDVLRSSTGLDFAVPPSHTPWRNYSRVFKLCLLVYEDGDVAVPTDIAKILSQNGTVTCDEYLHFLAEATTDPSPALSDWKDADIENVKHPLCFALKYILAKAAGLNEYITSVNEIVNAYSYSGFSGEEDDTSFLALLGERTKYESSTPNGDIRQARESIKFISQISYLHCDGSDIILSLSQEDAHEIFQSINPILGPRESDGNAEIKRLASLFKGGSEHAFFGYKNTVISDEIENGFKEGSKVKKTHIVIERNSKLRSKFFKEFPVTVCDACNTDTKEKYPWVERVLDIHHILPLASGTRVDTRRGTMLEDLAPVCPSCHRAIHRYYDDYLSARDKKDFDGKIEAKSVYEEAKEYIVSGKENVKTT